MSTLQYLNLIIINVVVWLLMSYFWSFWTFKLFKPFKWLEFIKQKDIPSSIPKLERKEKDKVQIYALWLQLERINKFQIQGSIAEVGVDKGVVAKFIHQMHPGRKLFLVDSFEGLPKQVIREDCDGNVRPYTVKFDIKTPEEIEKFISGNENVAIKKGLLSEHIKDLENELFSFVHIDAYLYEPTKEALEFFYPRLAPGGAIMIHDYNHNWMGVTKAVDEFCSTIPEHIAELPDQLGSVVLIKNRVV